LWKYLKEELQPKNNNNNTHQTKKVKMHQKKIFLNQNQSMNKLTPPSLLVTDPVIMAKPPTSTAPTSPIPKNLLKKMHPKINNNELF
jgi:hypothetical protein